LEGIPGNPVNTLFAFMDSKLLLSIVIGYFILLLVVAYYTSRGSNNESFFIGNKNSNWMLVAFGMIGTSLSGMTFISVPGTVGMSGFDYFQVVLGYFIGYFVVAGVLLPLYYRMHLTSIYSFLEAKLGTLPYKTGASFFILSRTLGATLRLYLVIKVLQLFILDNLGISFEVTAVLIMLMILLYTFKGGVKTIVWTDTLQTTFMLLALVVCTVYIMNHLGLDFKGTMDTLKSQNLTRIFITDPLDKNFFLKQILGGAFVTITMTGLDQEMMQKNISVSNLRDSKKNMMVFSSIMVLVNFLFLILGGLLFLYAQKNGLSLKGDDLFPTIAVQQGLPFYITVIFIIGLISALFPSADGALTALTSSFCIDILGMKQRTEWDEKKKTRVRLTVHLTMAFVFLLCIFVFREIDNGSLINTLLVVASYTYGPLLGLFAFGLFIKRGVKERLVPFICVLSPVICFTINLMAGAYKQYEWIMNNPSLHNFFSQTEAMFGGYKIGLEMLILNGLITIGLLAATSTKLKTVAQAA